MKKRDFDKWVFKKNQSVMYKNVIHDLIAIDFYENTVLIITNKKKKWVSYKLIHLIPF